MYKKLLLFLLLLNLFACSDKKTDEVTVKVVRVRDVKILEPTVSRTFSAVAEASEMLKLSFRVSGNINFLNVKIGDFVTKGQELAKLDSQDYKLKLQMAEAALMRVKAEFRHAKANYERIRQLYETHSASRNEFDAARAQAESADAAVKAEEKKRDLALSQLEYTTLRACSSGQIASVLVEQNENINSGEPVVVLNAKNEVEVKVFVPENLIGQVAMGKSVVVEFNAIDHHVFSGTVTEMAVMPSPGNTFAVSVAVPDLSNQIRPGVAAEVTFSFDEKGKREKLAVLSHAVLYQNGVHSVFVLKEDAKNRHVVERRQVEVGNLSSHGIEIVKGLKRGERVVEAGFHELLDGQVVEVIEN